MLGCSEGEYGFLDHTPFAHASAMARDLGIDEACAVRLMDLMGIGNPQKLVFAQDTGSAIVGAVRADYFAGTGAEAGEFASRMNQPLNLWVLWPK